MWDKYIKLKHSVSGEFAGISLSKAISPDLARFCYEGKRGQLFFFLKRMFFVKKICLKPFLYRDTILFSSTSNRKDYLEIINTVRGFLKARKKTNHMDIVGFGFKFSPVFGGSRYGAVDKSELSFFEYLVIRLLISNSVNTIENIINDVSVSKELPYAYIAFNSSWIYENIISMVMASRGVKTYSLQHGIYICYRNKKIPIDAINYENICADKLLCWSKYTLEELHKCGVEGARLVLAGYPKEYGIKGSKDVSYNSGETIMIAVFLARDYYSCGNVRLLKVLSELKNDKYLFLICLHPNSNIKHYSKYLDKTMQVSSRKNAVDIAGAAVVYNSTVSYDLISQGLPTFRYVGWEAVPVFHSDDEFTIGSEFDILLGELSNNFLVKQMNEMRYRIGLGVNNYENVILS